MQPAIATNDHEALAESLRTKSADLEARIYAVAPDLQLPVRFRKPSPVFAKRKLTRLAFDMPREAGAPLSIRNGVRGALAVKGM
jgi:hypothetical protein